MTAGALYVQQLIDPVDRLISWMDELQVGAPRHWPGCSVSPA